MGLGPTSNSVLAQDANDGSHSLIDQLILQEGTSDYITLLVSPLETDKGQPVTFSGLLTAGKTVDLSQIFGVSADRLAAVGVPVLSKVVNQPKIEPSNGTFSIDDILVSGKSVVSASGSNSAKPTAHLSTTNPRIVAPKALVDAVYADVPGSTYSATDRVYHLPCTAEVSVTIVIAGVSYPMSPLDVIATQVGSEQCVGTVSDSIPFRLATFSFSQFSSKQATALKMDTMW